MKYAPALQNLPAPSRGFIVLYEMIITPPEKSEVTRRKTAINKQRKPTKPQTNNAYPHVRTSARTHDGARLPMSLAKNLLLLF